MTRCEEGAASWGDKGLGRSTGPVPAGGWVGTRSLSGSATVERRTDARMVVIRRMR